MLESLAGEIRLAQGDATGAIALFAEARKRFPVNRALVYAQVDALSGAGRYQEAADIVGRELSARSSDAQLYRLQARALAGLGKQAAQHRALAEQYALQGNLVAAVEQLQVAQKAGDGDFYENSAIDARMRQLKAQQAEEKKLQRGGP